MWITTNTVKQVTEPHIFAIENVFISFKLAIPVEIIIGFFVELFFLSKEYHHFKWATLYWAFVFLKNQLRSHQKVC